MSIRNFVKNLFNASAKVAAKLQAKELQKAINDGYAFVVTPAPIEDTTLPHQAERAAANAGMQIMAVAVNMGVNGGYMVYGDYGVTPGCTYQENDFKITMKATGSVFLTCDPVFAEVVKTLPAVKDVKPIGANPAPQPKI